MSTHSTADRLFFAVLVALFLAAIGGLYWIIITPSWLARMGIFFGVACGLYAAFMAAVFGLAALGKREKQDTP